jgi:hypothetical protein
LVWCDSDGISSDPAFAGIKTRSVRTTAKARTMNEMQSEDTNTEFGGVLELSQQWIENGR